MSKSIIRISLLVLLLGAVLGGLFVARHGQEEQPVPTVESAAIDTEPDATVVDESGARLDETPDFEALTPGSDVADPTPFEQAFDYQLPLVEGIDAMALSGQWNYDSKAKNLAIWENLCTADKEQVSMLRAQSEASTTLPERLERFCAGFSSTAQEIDDFLEVEIVDRAAGLNERAALEDSLETLGADGATRLAVSELSRALDTLDYARVVEVVWFLGVYQFEGLSQRFVLYQRPPNVETNIAVASAIFCGDIGGCSGDHPITLSLCFQFRDLPCSSPPTDIYDAINQILTGHEIETYNSMTSRLIRLLNEYRRGNL